MKLHVFNSENKPESLYCMNRTSLENSFYATWYSIYTREMEYTGRRENISETSRSTWNGMESYGSLWKTQVGSIGNLGNRTSHVIKKQNKKEEFT